DSSVSVRASTGKILSSKEEKRGRGGMGEEVHLGLPGPWAEDYREKADHYTTKIGGVPDWPTEDMGIKPHLLQCSLCGTKLCLVAQVYAPVAKLNIESRTIYVLVCPTSKCGPNPQSWKVLRVQKCHSIVQTNGKVDEVDQRKASCNISIYSKKRNKLKHSNAPIKCPLGKVKEDDPSLPVLPCFYIYYGKEKLGGKGIVGPNSSESVSGKEIADVANDEEEKWEGESYEYDRALGADRTFLKFKKRLDAYPQQCFRYSYGGKPLLAATNLQESRVCKLCGAPRQYELQLMSPLSYFLHEASDGSSDYAPDNWTWLTLVIYTCSKNCCPSTCVGKLVLPRQSQPTIPSCNLLQGT
ncbi:hypothetical protein GUJ93_ZPchr0814g18764, partial [Zizania palustris]